MIGENGVQFKFVGGGKIQNNVYYMIPVLNKKLKVSKKLKIHSNCYGSSLFLWQDYRKLPSFYVMLLKFGTTMTIAGS